MSKITNSHTTALRLPDDTVIGSGETISVDAWDDLAKHGVVKQWIDAGILKADGKREAGQSEVNSDGVNAQAATAAEADSASDDAEKEALIAQLKELDVKADKRSSVAKLQELLAEAQK